MINTKANSAIGATLLCALLILGGCGGGGTAEAPAPAAPGPVQHPQAAPGAALAKLPPPSSLVGALPPQVPRSTSYVEADCVQNGNAFVPALPRNHEAALAGAQLSPNWVSATASTFADLAYVTYNFNVLGYDRAAQVRLAWTTAPVDFHNAWIALSHWTNNCWDWYQATSDGKINLPAIGQYIDPTGRLMCVVLCTGTDVSELASIRLGAPGPVVILTAAPSIGPVPLNVSLDASGSTAGEGTITKYEWDLDFDGTFETDTGATATENATVVDNGVRTVSVRVTNSSGSKSIASQDLAGIGPWQHTWGLSSSDEMVDATSDTAGNIYGIGYTRAPSLPFNDDLLLMKWSPTGSLIWAKKWDGSGSDYGMHVKLDTDGNLVAVGASDVIGNRQALEQKWSTDGDLLWSRQFGGPGWDSPAGLIVDGTDIYVGGNTDGWGATMDLFACKLDSSGLMTWSQARDHGEADYATDLAPTYWLLGMTGIIVVGESSIGSATNIWRVEYDLNGTFGSGAEFGTIANPKSEGHIRYWYDILGGFSYYFLTGRRVNGSDPELFFSCNDASGASVFGTRWWNTGAPEVNGMVFDSAGNAVICGYMPGFEASSYYGMLWKFDSTSGGFLTSAYLNDGAIQVRLSSVEQYFDGYLVSGFGADASGTWSPLTGSNGSFSDTWSTVDGTGGDLAWSVGDANGTVTDATADGTLDTGAGGPDALVLYHPPL